MERRELIRWTLLGGALASATPVFQACTDAGREVEGLVFFRSTDLPFVESLVRVVLQGAGELSPSIIRNVIRGFDRKIMLASGEKRADLRSLLVLLQIPVLRWSMGWHGADPAANLLTDCRYSRLLLKRQAYAGLREGILTSFYGSPAGWQVLGYPGPPWAQPEVQSR